MKHRRIMGITVAGLIATLLTVSAHAQELRKIRIGIPTLSPIVAATLVPRDRG